MGAGRRKRIYGDLLLPGDVVVEERESRLYGSAAGRPSLFPAMPAYADPSFLVHTEKPGVRSFDLLHVGLTLALKATEFLTCDSRQASLAKAAGLKVKP